VCQSPETEERGEKRRGLYEKKELVVVHTDVSFSPFFEQDISISMTKGLINKISFYSIPFYCL
jgi:hypothetical protein